MALQCSSYWSDLPTDILELIFDCTKDPIDILRSGAACKSWLPTALEAYRKFSALCFIDKGVFVNIVTKQTPKIYLPVEVGRWRNIRCSNNGWMLTIEDIDFPSNMHLLNIITRTRILLPPIISLYGSRTSKLKSENSKLFLSKSPSSSDCIILLVHDIKNITSSFGICKISLCKTGDTRWTNLGSLHMNTNSVLHIYKDKIYVSGANRDCISIFRYPHLHRVKDVYLPLPKDLHNCYNFFVKSEHEDDVFFAGCRVRSDQATDGKLFFVFKFDVLTEELKEVNDLGGYALFLSTNGNNLFVKTKPSLKANCIYFFSGCGCCHYGIYDLKTKDIEYVPSKSILIRDANWINLDMYN